MLAVLPSGESLGILADTTRRCEVLMTLNLLFPIDIKCLILMLNLIKQIDLRKESNVKFIAQSSYPIITFGPFASPTDVLIVFSHAIGNFLLITSFFFLMLLV